MCTDREASDRNVRQSLDGTDLYNCSAQTLCELKQDLAAVLRDLQQRRLGEVKLTKIFATDIYRSLCTRQCSKRFCIYCLIFATTLWSRYHYPHFTVGINNTIKVTVLESEWTLLVWFLNPHSQPLFLSVSQEIVCVGGMVGQEGLDKGYTYG